ncbi:Mur ligase family protein [Flavobacterium sp.]|uniref:UDP-N-acetylmuramate--L-alanine ligase n=1 Tax=Flavobacterium sp. TaxID=239 RepID=UPI002617C88C|nr:Mur ligase family protein [Flavobacterium sp.]
MKIHFIAVGGSAMHNLALALHAKGDTITGSDDAIFEPSLTRLKNAGLLPTKLGWFPEKITTSLDAVVLGMHAKEDNPELLRAKELGIKIYSYPEFLYEQGKNKTRVVIGGSHGKTSITSMVLHVLNYCDKPTDYMVGAQLEGFDRMVSIEPENEFFLIEGDEYLSSPIDRRPKFHLYNPNIAVISGIAWDHINVFPTFDSYVEQFRIFISKITPGGILIYNEQDEVVKRIVEESSNPIRKIPYNVPDFSIKNGITYLKTAHGELPLAVFGEHNLSNLAAAKWVCQCMGVDEAEFYEAIVSFKGASKRLELVARNQTSTVFKDFAHAPSKVKATTAAVKNQFQGVNFIACLELHTYSSLNPEFLVQYKAALELADTAVVFYDLEALKIKGMTKVSPDDIKEAFDRTDLIVFTTAEDFRNYVSELPLESRNSVLLLMSSGNYGAIDFGKLKSRLA